jgi:putative ABC transport system ATP-binding protein
MIYLENVSKKYGEIIALDDVSLKIQEGELVVLQGKSGSGKSSILSLIAALSKPTEGRVVVDGENIAMLPDHFASIYRREHIGFIFQRYNLIPTISVAHNIMMPLIPINLDTDTLAQKMDRVMQLFNIKHKANVVVKKLSGGEQQRVAIARANVNDPKIILADEPTANLDAKLSLEFIEVLKGLKAQGKTIVVATHDPLFFNLEAVDKVICIADGKVVKCS